MGLGEVQRGLAILLTDDVLREQLAMDPQGVGQMLMLDNGDLAQLTALANAEVERFARSLRAKRWNEIQKLLPISTQAAQQVGFSLRRVFLQFAQGYAPQGGKRHLQDALAFAAWAAQQPQATFRNTPDHPIAETATWLPDLLRYEAAWLEMQAMPSRRWILRRFVYPIPRFARFLILPPAQNALTVHSLTPRTTLCLWLRLPFRSQVRQYYLP